MLDSAIHNIFSHHWTRVRNCLTPVKSKVVEASYMTAKTSHLCARLLLLNTSENQKLFPPPYALELDGVGSAGSEMDQLITHATGY